MNEPPAKPICRPAGWKGKMTDRFLIKSSKYGVRYFCTSCGRIALGTDFTNGKHHHWKTCPRYEPDTSSDA